MAGMGKIIAAVIGVTVSIIIIGTVLVPQVTSMTTGEHAALAEYAGLLSAIVVISIVGCLMLAVSLISRRD